MEAIPSWMFEWSGSACVTLSLLYLWNKKPTYWVWSNLSTIPYFILFSFSSQWLLAGLQVSYLFFGMHGQYLWRLERHREQLGKAFNEAFWYNISWILSMAIFLYAAFITDFSSRLNWLQFAVTALSLLANWATTRRWVWSWPVWITVNLLQIACGRMQDAISPSFTLRGRYSVSSGRLAGRRCVALARARHGAL